MQIEYRNADSCSIDDLVVTLNRCFEDYLLPIRFESKTILNLIRVDNVDLSASIVALHEGQRVGVALIARRGWNSRLASMSIAPDFRGKRIGTNMTGHLLRAARDRSDRQFVLEVIEQNQPALRLYQSAGFAAVRRLFGYTADGIEGKEDAALEEVDTAIVASSVSRWGVNNLPWQISPHALISLGPPHRAFRLGPAAALFSNPTAETVTLCALVVESDARRQGWATRLLRALSARFPGKKWRFSVLVAEEIPEAFFTQLNFRKERMNQIQMSRSL